MDNISLIKSIKDLKRKHDALILVHNYQRPEIYEVADFIGDSLELCLKARNTRKKQILFCGVYFMAESAAILNPDKTVLIPDRSSGCAMADMLDAESLKKLQKQNPTANSVCYVNSTAEIKALCDSTCTSANAVDVVRKMPSNSVIFVPDRNLADYVAIQVPEKKIISFDGFCPIHNFVNSDYLVEIRKLHPDAKIIAHPESRPDILRMADYITSTSGMVSFSGKDNCSEYFVLTECGMLERLKAVNPDKKFYGLCNFCFDMKKITLQKVFDSLNLQKYIVSVPEDISKKALKSFNYMLNLK